MSDFSETPTTPRADAPPRAAKETSPVRLILLLSVFGVALAGLLYDYTIARPAIQKADNTIRALLDGAMPDPNNDGGVTEAEVQELLGCAPTTVKAIENGKIEVYTWRSGLPYRTYDLYVVYEGQRLPLLRSASTNGEPTESQLPPKTVIHKVMTPDEAANFVAPKPMSSSGSLGGGEKAVPRKGPPGAGKGKGRRGGGGAKAALPPTEPDTVSTPDADAAKDDSPAPTEPMNDTEPAKEEPAPAAEPAKEEPAPAAEPAKEEPAPAAEPAKEEPTGEDPPGDQPADAPSGGAG